MDLRSLDRRQLIALAVQQGGLTFQSAVSLNDGQLIDHLSKFDIVPVNASEKANG
jgi:hypothetical protein